jgi:hypothetical protein
LFRHLQVSRCGPGHTLYILVLKRENLDLPPLNLRLSYQHGNLFLALIERLGS